MGNMVANLATLRCSPERELETVMIGRNWGMVGLGLTIGLVLAATSAPLIAQPQSILPEPAAPPAPAPGPTPSPAATPAAEANAAPEAAAVPEAAIDEPVMTWALSDAKALLEVIRTIDAEGLLPADYQPDELAAALSGGEGAALDAQASRSFAWLIEDMRDGRTRMDARVQWFVVDPDVDTDPTHQVMAWALANHDVAGAIAALAPLAPDYQALKTALAATPASNKAKRDLIRINMDRWRWLPRDLGTLFLLTNVPEFQLRLTKNYEIVRSYRAIVGKPGKTATPSLAEEVQGVIFNPTWTVPQSIVKGEGLGERLFKDPLEAKREGYKVTKGKDGTYTVVQQPGPNNSLGLMKLDMPNEHAIFIHDTPARSLFTRPNRALSHGCVRSERATELGMTMAILGAGVPSRDLVQIVESGTYTKVPMTRTFPIYLTYFTMATNVAGKLGTFPDLYERDAPLLAAFDAPRLPWDGKRKTSEEVIQLDNPL